MGALLCGHSHISASAACMESVSAHKLADSLKSTNARMHTRGDVTCKRQERWRERERDRERERLREREREIERQRERKGESWRSS
jgi:hypothetical protein